MYPCGDIYGIIKHIVIHRIIQERIQKSPKSILLLAPRQCGKSTLINSLKPDFSVNLARESSFLQYSRDADLLENELSEKKAKTVFIDEVQRLPSLLNTIQYLVDEKFPETKFYLTGSSARKLKRGNANLLPGRLLSFEMGPLIASELEYNINLKKALSTGTLPEIYLSQDKSLAQDILLSYAATYLREEIQAEALTRNIEGFSRFLGIAAASNSLVLDVSKLSSKAQIARQSASRYFDILTDTLVVHKVPAYSKSEYHALIKHPRFFFFDVGVLNALLENFTPSEDRKGMLFENFIFSQIYFSAKAKGKICKIFHYRDRYNSEIDFIVELEGKTWAIEIKANNNPPKNAAKTLLKIQQKKWNKVVCHTGKIEKKIVDVSFLPWISLLKKMKL